MRLKLSTIMAIAVMAIAGGGFSLFGLFFYVVLTVFAFLADMRTPDRRPAMIQSRYERVCGRCWLLFAEPLSSVVVTRMRTQQT